jgi:DNA repair protein RadC
MIDALLAAVSPSRAAALASSLRAHYASDGAILAADPLALRGLGLRPREVAAIRAAHELSIAVALETLRDKPLLSSWDKVVAFLRALAGHATTESLVVIYTDNGHRLICHEVMATGTVNHAPIYPREVAKRALLRDAAAIILAHNHPSGDVTPSRADIDMTREVDRALKPLDVRLLDHIIVSPSSHASLRAHGHI